MDFSEVASEPEFLPRESFPSEVLRSLFWILFSGKSKWGLSKWGLKVLVHNCPRLPTIVVILRPEFPLKRGPKRPQKCTIVDDCARIAESGLKPPFESPHLDVPDFRNS